MPRLKAVAPDYEPPTACGCNHGALWPWATDSDFAHPYVERCDDCRIHPTDEDAANALAQRVDGIVVWHQVHDEPGRWQPAVHATPGM